MECIPLEIKVISAKDLKDVNIMTKMDVYVVVSITGDPFFSQQRTSVDKDGGTCPKWNHTMKFTVGQSAVQQNLIFLIFNIKSDRNLGDRDIGEVRVPVKELFDSTRGGENGKDHDPVKPTENFVTYSVRTPSGKSKGTLEFSYKFGDIFTGPAGQPKKEEEPQLAYPPAATGSSYPPPPSAPAYDYYPQPPQGWYQPPPPIGHAGYPHGTAPVYGYPPPQGYPPQMGGYGYPGVKPPKKKKKKGGNFGLGMGAGLLGGLLIGDMISDVGEFGAESAAYDAGFEDGFDF